MNNLKKHLILLVTLVFTNISFAQDGELLISATQVKNNIHLKFELLNEEKIAGVQFDIRFSKSEAKSLSTVSCTSSMDGSPLSGCSINGNILRVAVLSPNLRDLKSGELGSVILNNVNGVLEQELVVSNSKIFDSKGKGKTINAILDYKDIKILNSRDRNRFEEEK